MDICMIEQAYTEFLEAKQFDDITNGFVVDNLNEKLFDFESVIVRWALVRGRAAIFADTGLGKTFMQSEWAQKVAEHTNKPVLIFAPLAVSSQTIKEAEKFNITPIKYIRHSNEVTGNNQIYITNYEMQAHIDPSLFSGVVLDESSILKNQTGKTRNEMIRRWGILPYRLSCTATPSPNDFKELGNQAEFLGIMSMVEMLAMFFINDTGDTGTWRLKGHGKKKFWEWMATWAVVLRRPSDIGFSDKGYDLPPLNIIEHMVQVAQVEEGELFSRPAVIMNERRRAKRESIANRVEIAVKLVNESKESWIVWCHLNDESSALAKAIPDAVEVKGSDDISIKESRLMSFTNNKSRVLVSKPSICGYGMNWQHSHNMVFVGLDDSFEKYYQAIRRQWRFGQTHEVNVHIITTDGEGIIKANIERKQNQHDEISAHMVLHMRDIMQREILGATNEQIEYNPQKRMELPSWL